MLETRGGLSRGHVEMSDIYFKCACGKSLAVDEAGIGRIVSCVDCGKPVRVPAPEIEFECEGCGETLFAPSTILGDRIQCVVCSCGMTVPGMAEDRDLPAASAATRLMNDLLRRARELAVRRAGPHKPVFFLRLLRLAVTALALAAAGAVIHDVFSDREAEVKSGQV